MTFDELKKLNACAKALVWAEKYKDNPQKGWEECKRGDWMLWLLAKTQDHKMAKTQDHKKVVLTACKCVRRLALKYIPDGEDRPRIAIETTEAWCRGEATLKQVKKAADAAYDAVDAAYAAADAVAYAAAYAAASAASAASAAYVANVANAAYTADARTETLAECADIVREDWPHVP